MKKVLLGAAALLWAVPALAQVQQSGTVTARHPAYWVTSGAIGDPGGATDSALSSLGVTNEGGPGLCVSSQRASAAGRQQLCLSTGTSTGATISLTNLGTAPSAPLSFVIDGTTYPFPGSLANITIGVTPVVGGTNSQCLFVSGGSVGQQTCTLSAITSIIGDATATGPGVATLTLASVNGNVGTFGSGGVVPVITVNAKGLITAVSTTPAAITVGSTVITSGTTNGLLYANGSVLGNLTTLVNGVLVTSSGGVPSIATTLPSALTIPSPTFTGTETFPDAATWTSTGISKVAALSVGSATLPTGGNVSVSGQYQINGTQISAATGLSNGSVGTGAVVLNASPTGLSGTWAGSFTLSGNISHSGQNINTGTSAPASAGGQVYIMGTIAAPTLANTGQGAIYDTVAGGMVLQGDGSTSDITLANKSGSTVFTVPTGTTKLQFPSLSSGACSSGLGLDSGNNTVLISCPGAASSIQVGTTTVTSGTNNNILTTGTGTLANVTIASLLTAGSNITITGTTNATIATALNSAVLQGAPGNPTGTTSTTGVMMGLGSTCKLTPTYSTRVYVSFIGGIASTVGADAVGAQVKYGTGTAPSNGAAFTGTSIGPNNAAQGTTGTVPYSGGGIITGLTPGTAYWFDIDLSVQAGTTGSIVNVGCSAAEVL